MANWPQAIAILRLSGTHGDVLVAVGLADLLTHPAGQGARIREEAGRFVVIPPQPLSDSYLAGLPLDVGYPFVKTSERVDVPSGAQDPVDYRAERERADQYRKGLEKLRQSRSGPIDQDALAALQQLQPRPDWRLIQVLNTLQGDENTNRVHREIVTAARSDVIEWVKRGIFSLASGKNSGLPWKTTSVQLFTPSTAKGYSRLKPDSTARGDQTKEYWTDPFVEWLKYRGYFRIACPYFLGKKGEDIRLLCPIPGDITVRALSRIAAALRGASIYGGAAKLDALAALEVASLLIRHSQEYHDTNTEPFPDLAISGRTPAELISGLSVTHYQSLGSSRAVSSMAVLAIPGWFPIADSDDAQVWLAILDEHQHIVRGLNDDHSDEIGLLVQYRRFLERRGESALAMLLEFMGAYGAFLIRAREQGRRVRSFRTDHFRRIVMETNRAYTEILDNPGFQAVAAAVRRATVNAQANKAAKRDHREIRYDLLPELRRKRALSDSNAFIEVVSDFIASYNVENARRRELGKPAHRNVTTEEFAAFCRQVEEHGAPLVGALLCAFGSCREPFEEDSEEQVASDQSPALSNSQL